MKALAPAKVDLVIRPNAVGVVEHKGEKWHVVDFYYREYYDLERMTAYPEIYERTFLVYNALREAYKDVFGPLLDCTVGRLENGFFIKGTTTSAGLLGMIGASADVVGLDLYDVPIAEHVKMFKEQMGVDVMPTVEEIIRRLKEKFKEEDDE